MQRTLMAILAAASAVHLGGCATNPDVAMNYYLAKSAMKVKVVRTVACDAGNHAIIATTVTPAVTHSADLGSPKPIPIGDLDSALANNDIKFEFYEDGRLKGINAVGVGQGEAILKGLMTLATPFFGLDGGSEAFPDECKFVKDQGGGKPLTLTYSGDVAWDGASQAVKPEDASAFYQANLDAMIGGVCAHVDGIDPSAKPVTGGEKTRGVFLPVRQPAIARVRVTAPCGKDKVWEGVAPVAQKGTDYALPIPKSAAFGKRVFAVGFTESGALTSVQYASESGAPALLNVANAALSALDVTAAEKAAELKAEADVIAQQQRLVACMADPASCK